MSAEWCEHEPPVIISEKHGIPILSEITFFGFAAQDTVDALPGPPGHINNDGDLVVKVAAPPFPWAFKIATRIGKNGANPRAHSVVTYGTQNAPLRANEPYKITIALPDVIA